MSEALSHGGFTLRRPAEAASANQRGTIWCWLGLFANSISAIGILSFLLAPLFGISLPVAPAALFLLGFAAFIFCVVSWSVSAVAYNLRSVKVDSDAVGIALGMALLVPVGWELLATAFAAILAPMG